MPSRGSCTPSTQGRLDRTTASVLAVILVGLAVVVLVIEQKTRGKAAYHTTRPEAPSPLVPLSARMQVVGAIGPRDAGTGRRW